MRGVRALLDQGATGAVVGLGSTRAPRAEGSGVRGDAVLLRCLLCSRRQPASWVGVGAEAVVVLCDEGYGIACHAAAAARSMTRCASAGVKGRTRLTQRPWVVTFSPGFWSHKPRWWQVGG